jgi:argonaute-like protein implicated in RNA metabolism and viral defense
VSRYPVQRGTYQPLGAREVLLWTHGDAPEAVGGTHYFQGGKGTPSPILLRRFAGHGGWDASCRDVLGLTKMNWNHDSLHDRLPVTLTFAQKLARILSRMDKIGSRPFPVRLFI